jgi:uncharacterized protein YbaR (Trm112 family)
LIKNDIPIFEVYQIIAHPRRTPRSLDLTGYGTLIYNLFRTSVCCEEPFALRRGVIMAVDKDLLAILCCPETKQAVTLADAALIQRINEAIQNRRLQNKGKQLVTDPVEGGLLRTDAKILYPIRENIPVMLIEEGIPLEQVG